MEKAVVGAPCKCKSYKSYKAYNVLCLYLLKTVSYYVDAVDAVVPLCAGQRNHFLPNLPATVPSKALSSTNICQV